MSMLSPSFKPIILIDIVSDVVCPWCYIGKRRIEKAMADLSDTYTFLVTYYPFELNPQMPSTGADQREYLTKKFGGAERYKQITEHVTQVAATEGLQFNFDKQRVSPNTRNLHRVIELARQQGRQAEVKEAFLKAYFTDGTDLSKIDAIVDVAGRAGLHPESVSTLLAGNDGLAEIELAEREMQRNGVTGVPFFIINNKYGISGAQPSETFKQAFNQIASEVPPTTDEACSVDGKNC